MITNRLPAGAAGAQPPAAAVARVAVAERGRALAVGAVARVAVAELVLAARATGARGAAPASRVPAARGTVAWRVAGRGTAGARRGNLLARRGHAQAEGGGGVRVFRFLDDRVLLELELVVEQVPDRILLDPLHHGVEQVVALALVLDQRVPLGHRP